MSASKNKGSVLDGFIRFGLENKLVVFLAVIFFVVWGALVAPFDWKVGDLPRDPVPVDAIPDIGENQQIVFTEWMGRSPQDVEDQITYPLTVSLLGVPGVKTIRSYSAFGFSMVFVIFKEDIEFYWSRTRILEKISSLPANALPDGVSPRLGPDATALGQVYWYTLEGRDQEGRPAPGWDLQELRSVQDWYVRYALMSVDGVAEVASIGGFVKEYQVDVNPDAMRATGVHLSEVYAAIRMSNVDVGARTIEINRAEYVIRGLGFIKSVEDVEQAVIKVTNNIPIRVKDVAHVTLGPALRRGALDKAGAEAVGGVVVTRFGANPLASIKRVKQKIQEISTGLPKKTLDDGRISQVTIVPFYDRAGLIYETLGTLQSALTEEMLVTAIVVLVLVMHLGSSILISGLLPLAVLMCFIAMRQFGVDANIVALSGIAIAIGTMVDMGIVICENILKHIEEAPDDANYLEVVFEASSEVGSAVLTAVLTTVISFLPVFSMEGPEGKLFKPLAFTKTFALLASIVVALAIIPPMAHLFFTKRPTAGKVRTFFMAILAILGVALGNSFSPMAGGVLFLYAIWNLLERFLPKQLARLTPILVNIGLAVTVAVMLAEHWSPLGSDRGLDNILFVLTVLASTLGFFGLLILIYEPFLRWCLDNKFVFLLFPVGLTIWGGIIWLGFEKVFSGLPPTLEAVGVDSQRLTRHPLWVRAKHKFPGLGKEFMPPLNEDAYLLMPTTMPHASIGEVMDVLSKQDMAIQAIPEVEMAVGKLGRVESPLDPAPISMIETIIQYKSEYITDKGGHRISYRYDASRNEYSRDEEGQLIENPDGRPFRQWRDHIKTPDDIWDEIVKAAMIPGTTSAPRLQPIAARIVMLQSGMRAPMGIKIKGPDLKTIETVGLQMEKLMKEVPSVQPAAVFADRIIGKPYIEVDIDRKAIARYGMSIRMVQDIIEVAIGGKPLTTTVEGRERYPVRVRYMRELRDSLESLEKILVPAMGNAHIPLGQLAKIRYTPGPQVIKSEDTFLIGYVLFDMKPGHAEVDVVEECQAYLDAAIRDGRLDIPKGVSFRFSGSYENQIRSEKRLMIVLPVALFFIFLILYFQFKSVITTFLVFSGIFVAWSGGFQMLWLYSQDWFLNFSIYGENMRQLFNVHPINLSVAVWVGFLALFGIATDDGVIMTTYLTQTFDRERPSNVEAIREATVHAGKRRIRPCLMTVATTILALIPVLTSTGRGSDVMVPMAIPSFGGMTVVLITVFVVPTLYCFVEELKLGFKKPEGEYK